MKRKGKIRIMLSIIFVAVLILSNVALFLSFTGLDLFNTYHDVDRRPNGNTFICSASFNEMINLLIRRESQTVVTPKSSEHKIFEVDRHGRKVWQMIGLAYPHEVDTLPDGHIMIADTGYDRVIEVDYPNTNIVWSWEPANINWTEVNPNWGAGHYYNNPTTFDWTHVNDVDFYQHGTWNACLISLRNFDLIVEVNYTADFLDPNNASNIVWHYGDHENFTLLRRQHNPDYLSSGNIIISDSANNRIIEVNKTTNATVWTYNTGLRWPRDADELSNGNLLITDCFNGRILEVEKSTKRIVWSYISDLIIPYESDKLPNGNILISDQYSGVAYEINTNGVVIWRYGVNFIKSIYYLNVINMCIICMIGILFRYRLFEPRKIKPKHVIYNCIMLAFWTNMLIFGIILLIQYAFLITTTVQAAYPLVAHML